jgi:FkbM family methyltransferase
MSADSRKSTLGTISQPLSILGMTTRIPALAYIASLWNRYSPRGKGAVPRWIGRTFGRRWHFCIETDSGCKLAVDPRHLDLFLTIRRDGAWEPWIRKACLAATRDDDVFFDVGGNVGAISCEVALARRATIVVFEPQPGLGDLIRVSAALNGIAGLCVLPFAVGDREQDVAFFLEAHALHGSLKALDASTPSVPVKMVSIDGLVESGKLEPPSVIKVDVEGGELGVFQGAVKTIRRYQPVLLFEVNENCERFGYSRQSLLTLIRSLGDYSFFKVAPGDILAAPGHRFAEFSEMYPVISED